MRGLSSCTEDDWLRDDGLYGNHLPTCVLDEDGTNQPTRKMVREMEFAWHRSWGSTDRRFHTILKEEVREQHIFF
jgi:hypothetical protein